jgi:pyrimidine deaminase RibD-like protein
MSSNKLRQECSVDHNWLNPPAISPVSGGRHLRWLEVAAKMAAVSDGKWRVGCVIVRGGRVLAAASNTVRNDPATCRDTLWESTEHAEMAALRLAGNPKRATVYVARIGRDGAWRHAQPCRRCQEVLDEHEVRVVWTSDPAYVSERVAS